MVFEASDQGIIGGQQRVDDGPTGGGGGSVSEVPDDAIPLSGMVLRSDVQPEGGLVVCPKVPDKASDATSALSIDTRVKRRYDQTSEAERRRRFLGVGGSIHGRRFIVAESHGEQSGPAPIAVGLTQEEQAEESEEEGEESGEEGTGRGVLVDESGEGGIETWELMVGEDVVTVTPGDEAVVAGAVEVEESVEEAASSSSTPIPPLVPWTEAATLALVEYMRKSIEGRTDIPGAVTDLISTLLEAHSSDEPEGGVRGEERSEESGGIEIHLDVAVSISTMRHDRARCLSWDTGPGSDPEMMNLVHSCLNLNWFRPGTRAWIFKQMDWGEHGEHYDAAVKRHGGPDAAMRAGAFGTTDFGEKNSYRKFGQVLEAASRRDNTVKSQDSLEQWGIIFGPAKSRGQHTAGGGWYSALRQVMVSLHKKRGFLNYARCLDEYLRHDASRGNNLLFFSDFDIGPATEHIRLTLNAILGPFLDEIVYGKIFLSIECVTANSLRRWSQVKKKRAELKTACEYLHMKWGDEFGIHIEGWGTTFEHLNASVVALHKCLMKQGLKLLPGETPWYFHPYASLNGMALGASVYEVIASHLAVMSHYGSNEESGVFLVQDLSSAGSTPMIHIREQDRTGTGNRLTAGDAASVWILVTPRQCAHVATGEPLVPRGSRNNP